MEKMLRVVAVKCSPALILQAHVCLHTAQARAVKLMLPSSHETKRNHAVAALQNHVQHELDGAAPSIRTNARHRATSNSHAPTVPKQHQTNPRWCQQKAGHEELMTLPHLTTAQRQAVKPRCTEPDGALESLG